MAILGLRFNGNLVLTEFMSFTEVSELLGIPWPLTKTTRGSFGPTIEPQIRMQWLKLNIPWTMELDEIALKRFFFYFINSCLFGNN